MRLLDRRALLIAAGWLLAVVLAVLVGVVGIGLVGAGLTSRQGAPVSEEQVERELRGLGSAPPPSSSSRVSAAQGRSFATRGGTVVADCQGILSMAPAQGFAVHEQEDDEGEFRSADDDTDRVEVELTCVGGVPELHVSDGD